MDLLPKEIEDIIINDARDMEAYEKHRERMKKVCKRIDENVIRYEDYLGDREVYVGWGISKTYLKKSMKDIKFECQVCNKCGGIIQTYIRNLIERAWCDCNYERYGFGEFGLVDEFVSEDGYESMDSNEGSIEF